MRFAIRDDDANYYTNPEELLAAYQNVFNICPPSISVITHVKGNWTYWLKQLSRDRKAVDLTAWKKDDKVYPIGDNKQLSVFLKENFQEGKIDLCLHAVHHRNEDLVQPNQLKNNFVYGAEFYTREDPSGKIKNAIHYLNEQFSIAVSVFTPPQNLLSLKGYHAVVKNKLSMVGSGMSFWKKEKSLEGLQNMSKVIRFKAKFPGKDYPFVLYFKKHAEAVHHYPLHPTTKVAQLIEAFNHVRNFDGDFVLSTHHHEFEAPLTYDSNYKMKDVFNEFMSFAIRAENVEFCTLSSMLSLPK